MIIISCHKFQKLTYKDPRWAETIKEPTAISGRVILKNHPIECLSPYLHFTNSQQPAVFISCERLETGEGVFYGGVKFDRCSFTRVHNLFLKETQQITKKTEYQKVIITNCKKVTDIQMNVAAEVQIVDCPELKAINLNVSAPKGNWRNTEHLVQVMRCKNAKRITATVEGSLILAAVGITSTKKINVLKANASGLAAEFTGLDNLTEATGRFPGSVKYDLCGIRKAQNLHAPENITAPIWDGSGMPPIVPAAQHTTFARCWGLESMNNVTADAIGISWCPIEYIGTVNTTQMRITGCDDLDSISCALLEISQMDFSQRQSLKAKNEMRKKLRKNPSPLEI